MSYIPENAADRISASQLSAWLTDGNEIAFVDTREEGIYGEGHPLLAVNIPFSRLEIDIFRLVPRVDTRLVFIAEQALAGRISSRFQALGYSNVYLLDGGTAAWEAQGYKLFKGVNVPSKAFAECVEHHYHTPALEAEELSRLQSSGADIVVLDPRTRAEYEDFHVPGAISSPGAEIVARFDDLVPRPETLVVVSCAGRTRGIVGAQALINAGVPNKVAALSGGTQGWRLAGFDLVRGTRAAPYRSTDAARRVNALRSTDLASRYDIAVIDNAGLKRLIDERSRTTYLFDVRQADEYAGIYDPRFTPAEGGQLVQSLDKWAATRGSRIVLADDGSGVRAILTAHWLRQLGWETVVYLIDPDEAKAVFAARETPETNPRLISVPLLTAQDLKARCAAGAALFYVGQSASWERAHVAGSTWVNRSRLDEALAAVEAGQEIVVLGENGPLVEIVAHDIASTGLAVVRFAGGVKNWSEAGLTVSPATVKLTRRQRIDFLFWLHDRHSGNNESSRQYLDWELDLPKETAAPEINGFNLY